MDGLKPQTTYDYKVSSMGEDGESDGVESPVSKFITPASGERALRSCQRRPCRKTGVCRLYRDRGTTAAVGGLQTFAPAFRELNDCRSNADTAVRNF
jgi:hypothetical protein